MKKIDLGQTMNTLANIGVIVGIVFLAFELRQTQLVGRAQTRNEISQTALNLTQFTATREIGAIVLKSDRGENLTALEQWQLSQWLASWLNFYENLHYQYRQGLLDESEFSGDMANFAYYLRERPSFFEQYCVLRARGTLSPEFVEEADALLEQPCE